MTNAPGVSILLPFHGGAAFLKEAVASVLSQTFNNFELIIIEDRPESGAEEVLCGASDSRIRIIRCSSSGISAALNLGLQAARSDLIARMDADDVCVPRRLEQQTRFMSERPDIALSGSWVNTFGASAHMWRFPVTHSKIVARLLFGTAIAHPTYIFNRKLLGADLYYDSSFDCAEDYELCTRLCLKYKMANLPQALLRYRTHAGQVSAKDARPAALLKARILFLSRLELALTPEHERIHALLSDSGAAGADLLPAGIESYWGNIKQSAALMRNCRQADLLEEISTRWNRAVRTALRSGRNDIALSSLLFDPILRARPVRHCQNLLYWGRNLMLGVKK